MVASKKRVAIFSDVNPTKSYSCIQYLAESLSDKGINVYLYAKIPVCDLKYTKNWRCNVFSIYNFFYGKIPLLRRYLAQFHFFILSAFYFENVIVHELTFFKIIWLAKKVNKKLNVIHYATELYDETDEPSHKKLLKFYKNNSNLPSLVIECNEKRRDLRRTLFGVNKPIVIIENTLPCNKINSPDQIKLDSTIYNDVSKTLIYTGAAYLHRELDRLIDAFDMCDLGGGLKLILVCYGPQKDISVLKDYCEHKISGKYILHTNVSRYEAMNYVSKADIGIVYYRPSLSIGNRFAAPTKFYEYLSLGLPVVCSNNDSLIPIIDKYKIGKYVDDESVESLSKTIKLVYQECVDGSISRTKVQNVFIDSLSYDVTAEKSLETIIEKLN